MQNQMVFLAELQSTKLFQIWHSLQIHSCILKLIFQLSKCVPHNLFYFYDCLCARSVRFGYFQFRRWLELSMTMSVLSVFKIKTRFCADIIRFISTENQQFMRRFLNAKSAPQYVLHSFSNSNQKNAKTKMKLKLKSWVWFFFFLLVCTIECW